MASEVGTNVKIKLVSTIIPTGGEREAVEMSLQGSKVERAGISYLRYDEVHEDASIRTTVKLTNDNAVIMRSGQISMRLPLNIEQCERGHYENIHGSFPIEVKTYVLKHEAAATSGQFDATYDLIIGGQTVGNYTLQISYSEVQQ